MLPIASSRSRDRRGIVHVAGSEQQGIRQPKVGDQVKATYYESLAVRVRKPPIAVAGVTESVTPAVGAGSPGFRTRTASDS